MQKNQLAALTMFAIFVLGGCATTPDSRYLLSFYDVSAQPTDELIENVLDSLEPRLATHGGELAVAPIRNTGPLHTAAIPEYTTNVPGDYLIISRFPSQKALDSFLESDEIRSDRDRSGVHIGAMVTAKVFKPMPTMPDYPVIGTIDHRHDPAFILLNGISMNSMVNPMTGIRMLRYMNANLPTLEEAGTIVLAAFEALDVVAGKFDFDMLFLTEWPSLEVFNDIHAEASFIDLARKTRNRAFNRFADDQGLILFDLGQVVRRDDSSRGTGMLRAERE